MDTGQALGRGQGSAPSILVSRSLCAAREITEAGEDLFTLAVDSDTQHTAHESRQNYKMWIHKDKIIRHIVTKVISKTKNLQKPTLKTSHYPVN